MMPGANIQANTNVKIPLAFIIYALMALIMSQVILLFATDLLTTATFRMPRIWMAAHFLLLGFAVMVVMGAMYQLVPVAFLTPIWNQTFGVIQFCITITGFTVFSLLLGWMPQYAIYGGMISGLGIAMFILQMFLTILKQKEKTVMTAFVLAALCFLVLAVLAGLLLAWNVAFGTVAFHTPIFYSHLIFAITGWFTLLIFAFSYKLVPMFSLSHGFSMKGAKCAFFTYIAGLLLLICAFWVSQPFIKTVGFTLQFIGFTFFVMDIKEILKKRLKRRLDKPFSFSILAIFIGYGLHFLALISQVANITDATYWSLLIFCYLIGWIIFSILGYLYKIVPFLWWTHKYAEIIGQVKVPTMAEMINEKLSITLFSLFITGLLGLIIGVFFHSWILVFIFQLLLTITSILYAISIIKVLFK